MIHNIDKIDIMAKRKDGGIDMFIISDGSLDASPETQTKLMDKIQNYLGYINSNDFKNEFGQLQPEQISIILQCEYKPDEIIYKLFDKIKEWVKNSGAYIEMTVKNNLS